MTDIQHILNTKNTLQPVCTETTVILSNFILVQLRSFLHCGQCFPDTVTVLR